MISSYSLSKSSGRTKAKLGGKFTHIWESNYLLTSCSFLQHIRTSRYLFGGSGGKDGPDGVVLCPPTLAAALLQQVLTHAPGQ